MLIAELSVRPGERLLTGPNGSASVEPLVMNLFVELASRAGTLVTRRELFNRLWGSLAVGDDNLNRLVAALRRTLNQLGVRSLAIETVPATGYVLRLRGLPSGGGVQSEVQQALSEARDSWRLALPEPDHLRIALLERAAEMDPEDFRVFGFLALLHRHAAEYAPPDQASAHVAACEHAARRALELDPTQVEAATALVSVAPLYGRWFDATRRLTEICAAAPDHPLPANDLATVEMATGQIACAKARRDRLVAGDPLAAHFGYKTVYQHWSVGDLVGMDHAADRAMQLWPFHPAVWTVRIWTLVYTDRFAAAEAMLPQAPPAISAPTVAALRHTIHAAASGRSDDRDDAALAAIQSASRGPAQAVAALFTLALFGRVDDCFAVARRYYLQAGEGPVPLQPQADHPQLNEQHRRLTQVLFTPAGRDMRDDPRFADLCHSIGLTDFWEASGITPDYLRSA
jgi:hypothetical protein